MRLKFLFAWVFLAENHGLRAWWATQSMGSKRVRHNWETKHISTQTHMSCEILVPQPGIKPESPVMEAQSLNHWTAREARRLKCFKFLFCLCDISLMVQTVKNPPAMQETRVWSLGWEDPPEKGMATHSRILAWRIAWTEEPGGLPWGCKESNTTELLTLTH